MKRTENTYALAMPDDAMRQYIDASAAFSACEAALTEAAQVRGGMYWHKGPPSVPDRASLVRTSSSGGEKSLGPRSADTERIYQAFVEARMRPGRGWPASGTRLPGTAG